MNILNFTVLFVSAFYVTDVYCGLFTKAEQPLFTFQRVFTKCDTITNKDLFLNEINRIVALGGDTAQPELAILFNCPKSIDFLTQIDGGLVQLYKNPNTPQILLDELENLLRRNSYGSLQVDHDRSLRTCIIKMEEKSATWKCKGDTCTESDIETFRTDVGEIQPCTYFFMKDQIKSMFDALKKDLKNTSTTEGIRKKLEAIFNTNPLKRTQLITTFNKLFEDKLSEDRRKIRTLIQNLKEKNENTAAKTSLSTNTPENIFNGAMSESSATASNASNVSEQSKDQNQLKSKAV